MIEIRTDSRGKVSFALRNYLKEHPRIAKNIKHIQVNNQSEDIIIITPEQKIAIEMKIGQDLHSSLVSGRLEKELTETYSVGDFNHRYVMICGVYHLKDLAWAVSIIDRYHPLFHIRLFSSLKHAIKGIVGLAQNPPDKLPSTPVLVRTEKKGFILSLSSFMNGITTEFVDYMLNRHDSIIQNWRDFFTHDKEEVREFLLRAFYDFYGKKMVKIVDKLMGEIYG